MKKSSRTKCEVFHRVKIKPHTSPALKKRLKERRPLKQGPGEAPGTRRDRATQAPGRRPVAQARHADAGVQILATLASTWHFCDWPVAERPVGERGTKRSHACGLGPAAQQHELWEGLPSSPVK